MALWEGAGAVKQKEKYKAQENCQVTNFRFVWWYTGGGAWLLGKCEGVTEKSDEFISEWEVESEKTSFTVKENGCQQVRTFFNHFPTFPSWGVNIILHVKLVFPKSWEFRSHFNIYCSQFSYPDVYIPILWHEQLNREGVSGEDGLLDVPAIYSYLNSDTWGSLHHDSNKLERMFKVFDNEYKQTLFELHYENECKIYLLFMKQWRKDIPGLFLYSP